MNGPDHLSDLMDLARRVRQRMRAVEVSLGLTFTLPVRFRTAMAIIKDGLVQGDWLGVAVGYLMLQELMDQAQADQASRN